MFYKFPVIHSIDDIAYTVRDDADFSIKEKNGFIFIDYILARKDTFPPIQGVADALRRECRGITFDAKSGKIRRRPFHKFFNAGERPETTNVLMSLDAVVLDKADGSMIAPFSAGEGEDIYWGTRAGATDVASQARDYIVDRRRVRRYERTARLLMDMGWTPIFEWTSPQNRIVLAYEPNLTLTAIRHMTSGQYMSYDHMLEWGRIGSFPVISSLSQDVIKDIRLKENTEGVVIRYPNGHMIKIKSEWYCQLHKMKEQLRFEKDAIHFIINGMTDDIQAFLQDDIKIKFEEFEKQFWLGVDFIAHSAIEAFDQIKRKGMSRKEFAISEKDSVEKPIMTLLFASWDDHSYQSIRKNILFQIGKNLSTQTSVNKVRCLWDNRCKWEI